jgi:hypothetical protein
MLKRNEEERVLPGWRRVSKALREWRARSRAVVWVVPMSE